MASGGMMWRLALAALASGAAAGMLLPLTLFVAAFAAGTAASWWAFAALVDWLKIGFVAGLVLASFPAFFAGASMWALAGSIEAARRPSAWAAAGAAVGGAGWTLLGLMLRGGGAVDAFELAILAAALAAGAGAALAFRGTMRLLGPCWAEA